MPKKSIEINKFTGGIVSTPSSTDSDPQSASFSLNIESQESDGRLQGIDKNKVYTIEGFKSGTNSSGNNTNPTVTSMTVGWTNVNRHWWTNFGTDASTTKTNLQEHEDNNATISHGVCWAQIASMKKEGTRAEPYNGSTTTSLSEAVYLVMDPNQLSRNWSDTTEFGYSMSVDDMDGHSKGHIPVKFHDDSGFLHHVVLKRMSVATKRGDKGHGDGSWDNMYKIVSPVRRTGANFTQDSSGGNTGWVYGSNKMVGYRTHIYVQINNYIDFIRIVDTSFTDRIDDTNAGFRNSVASHFNLLGNGTVIRGTGLDVKIDLSVDTSHNIRNKIMTGISNLIEGTSDFTSIFPDTYVSGTTTSTTADEENVVINFNKEHGISLPKVIISDYGDWGYEDVGDVIIKTANIDYVSYAPFLNCNSNGPTKDSLTDDSLVLPEVDDGGEINWNAADYNFDGTLVSNELNINVNIDLSECVTVPDKENTKKVNLIGINTNTDDTPQKAIRISDIHNDNIGNTPITLGALNGIEGEYDIEKDADTVHFGLGGGAEGVSKVAINTSKNPLSDNNTEDEMSLELSELFPPNHEDLAKTFAQFIVPSVGEKTYHYTLHADPRDRTLAKAIRDDSITNVTDQDLKPGEVFKVNTGGNEFSDGACLAWKKYDYEHTSTVSVVAGDLFMYCGDISGTTAPILRYMGNVPGAGEDDGTPAFAYGIKHGGSSVYKISLSTSGGGNANVDPGFAGDVIGNIKDYGTDGTDGADHSISNVGSRITKIDASSIDGAEISGVTAISECHSPPLYNNINLVGHNEDPYGATSSIFDEDGTEKLHYHFGVFYLAQPGKIHEMYRVNLIDFHNISVSGPRCELLNLSFEMIPTKLHEENGDGIVRRTLQDQVLSPDENPHDPKYKDWTNHPRDAEIVGICETYEEHRTSLEVDPQDQTTWTGHNNIIRLRGNNEFNGSTRLSIGEVIRFKGFDNSPFNQEPPYMIMNGGDMIQSNDSSTPPSDTNGTGKFYSYRVWIIYRKLIPGNHAGEGDQFKEWDLFLYSANTIDMKESRKLLLADRTPPFSQARYYRSSGQWEQGVEASDDLYQSGSKMWYPGQFAYIENAKPGYELGIENYTMYNPWRIYNKAGFCLEAPHNNETLYQNGGLYWGENIGWHCNYPRRLNPIQGSLHPLYPYNQIGGDNGCGHVVTFTVNQSGTFIQKPSGITRYGNTGGVWHAWDENYEGWGNPVDTKNADLLNYVTKEYADSLVLYTIDNYTGHGRYINEEGDAATDLTNEVAGCKPGAPNWGGPEIENPNHKQESDEISNTAGGTKGWNGYTPPYLFNPGKGPYVYINRVWKNANRRLAAEPDSDYDDYKMAHFLIEDWNIDADADFTTKFTGARSNNRYHNFSITAMHDIHERNSHVPFSERIYVEEYEDDISARYYNTRFAPPKAETANAANMNPMQGLVGNCDACCTMHRIIVEQGGQQKFHTIQSTFPIKMTGGTSLIEKQNFHYNISYMISGRTISDEPSTMIFRTNYNGLWDTIIRYNGTETNASTREWHTFNGNPGSVSYKEHLTKRFGSNYGNQDDWREGHFPFQGGSTSHMETLDITTGSTERTPNLSASAGGVKMLRLRAAAQRTHTSYPMSPTFSSFAPNGGNAFFTSATLDTPSLDWWTHAVTSGDGQMIYGYEENAFQLDNQETNPQGTGGGVSKSTYYEEDTGGTYPEGDIFTGLDDDSIRQISESNIEFAPGASTSSAMELGDYYYRLTLEYDNQHESPLIPFDYKYSLPSSDTSFAIKITIRIPKSTMNQYSKRVTGIGVWRRLGGNEIDAYSQVRHDHILKFTDPRWVYQSASNMWEITIEDSGNTGAQYETLIGVPQTLESTGMNYGLSAVHEGYMYVGKCWNRNTEDIRRYIFRSQPGNFFAFDWSNDFLVLPEEPIALASWNTRLYAWGQNSLYKIDPFTLIIEDIYDGVSIFNKNSFVKTEFGLCFFDKNNIYLHNGNQPIPIGDAILYSSNTKTKYHTVTGVNVADQGYVRVEQGFRELLDSTIANGDDVNIHYLGRKDVFAITLSDTLKDGKIFAYNLRKKRWDLWDAPRPAASSSSKDGSLLLLNGYELYNILSDESKQYTDYNKKQWDWYSNDLAFNNESQDKVFKTLSLSGTPSVFNYNLNDVIEYDSTSSLMPSNSVQAYVDDKQVALSLHTKFYTTVDLGGTHLRAAVATDTANYIQVTTSIRGIQNSGVIEGGDGQYSDIVQTYIRPGHLIKIDSEIMLVTAIGINNADAGVDYTNYETILWVTRGVMGTNAATHLDDSSVHIVSPKFKFPSGSKGRRLNIRLLKQSGYVDAIGVTYKDKSIK